MQVFKTACRVILRHPIYLIVYIMVLSTFGLFLVSAVVGGDSGEEYIESRPRTAVIDRDGTEISQGLTSVINERSEFVEIDDTEQALQDASAQGAADYILIIPEGYTDAFFDVINAGEEGPRLEYVGSYTSLNATLMDQITNQYMALVQMEAVGDPSLSRDAIAQDSVSAMQSTTPVEVSKEGDASQAPEAYIGFLRFSAYPLTVGIVVCITMLMSAFNKAEIRRRNIASPMTPFMFNAQTALGCVMVALFAWAWVNALGLIAFGGSLAGVPLVNIALILGIVLAFVTVPLALGYLFSQLGLKENVANAVGNIFAMALSFLGGAWVDPSLLGDEVVAVAHFTPSYWYASAIERVAELSGAPSSDTLMAVFGDVGIVLLFTLAIFVIALVVGRLRQQTKEAGGNTAAARSIA